MRTGSDDPSSPEPHTTMPGAGGAALIESAAPPEKTAAEFKEANFALPHDDVPGPLTPLQDGATSVDEQKRDKADGGAAGQPSPEIPKAGLYNEVPDWAKAMPMLHQSIAKELLVSPLHGWWRVFREEPEPFDAARNFGTVCHSVLLGGKDLVMVDAPDWRTAAAREQRDRAIQEGKLPILQRQCQEAAVIRLLVAHSLLEHGLQLHGQSEQIAIWRKNGVWCQGKIDHLILPAPRATKKLAMIYDFKFIGIQATKKSCENRFIEHGLDIQHAAYVEAVETIYPKLRGRVEMVFIFVEVEAPNAIRVMPLAGSMRTSGQWRWAKARRIWRECLSKYGKDKPWPAYQDDGELAECPAWALNQQIAEAETRQIEEALR